MSFVNGKEHRKESDADKWIGNLYDTERHQDDLKIILTEYYIYTQFFIQIKIVKTPATST